jgi:uncharacterized protein (DUF58 family)
MPAMRRSAPPRLPRSLIPVTRRISGLLHGDYSGLLHRAGSELGDIRRYNEGDDVRLIDWPATARTNETQVHDTIADHELDVWLVVDASSSMSFGTARSTKFRLAIDVAGAIGLLVVQSGNRVGCIVAGADGHFLPRAGTAHLAAILATLERGVSTHGGNVADPVAALAVPMSPRTRRGLVVVISDFLDAGWSAELARLSRRHDVMAVVVADPREFTLPSVGIVNFEDPETGRVTAVDTSRREVRERFAVAAQRRFGERLTALRAARVDVVDVRTDSDWVPVLAGFLRSRKRRLATVAR